MSINYSVYPDALVSYGTLPLRIDGVHEIVAADHNRLRDSIVKIQQELGIQPSSSFATVASRLDNIGDASSVINAHIIDLVDAHDASSISVLDTSDNYVSGELEGVITELAAALPKSLNTVGNNNVAIPNSGIPDFVAFTGTRFGFNTGSANPLKQTQPVSVTGIRIIDIGDANGNGSAELSLATSGLVKWKAPGDSFGAEVDVSVLSEGGTVILQSSDTSKQIRVARTSASLPSPTVTDTFDILRPESATGAISITATGITDTNYVTRTASTSTGTSRDQFVISGIVYPADKGTLVLQRKLRSSSDFAPLATLDLDGNFDESLRDTNQPVYSPDLTDFDTITLFDRLPARNDYDTLSLDASGNQVYSNLDISSTFSGFQFAKYIIPISNADLVGGDLDAPTDITATEMNGKVSTYRIVHYKTGITDFNGTPATADIFSLYDSLGAVSDGDNNIRMSNVVIDSNDARPDVLRAVLYPEAPEAEASTKYVSGVNYYNSTADKFYLEIESNTDLFSNTYLSSSILTFGTDVFSFPSGSGFGTSIDVTQMFDDGYAVLSDSNLPDFSSKAFYLINATYNTGRKLFPEENKFSTNAFVSSTLHDPFGGGTVFDSYGFVLSSEQEVRILVNSYARYRATETVEYFTDESFRVGRDETFNFNIERDQFSYHYGTNGDGYQLYLWDEELPIFPGDLQLGGRFGTSDFYIPGLIFPQSNYSSAVVPIQENSPDYSTDGYINVDESYYQRLFNLGKTVNSGKLRVESGGDSPISFNDMYYGNSSRCMKISVKIPGVGYNSTGWQDLGRLAETGKFEKNSGALQGSVTGATGNFVIPFTFQNRNNSDCGNMIAIRVTYFGSQSVTAKTKILTRLTLLEAD